MSAPSGDAPSRLSRRLGLGDAVVIGLGSMIGAGVSAAIGPAARAAVYGRERLGPFWGYLAGWGFVVGKAASDQWVFVHNDRDGMSAPIALQIAELDERSEDISCTDWGPHQLREEFAALDDTGRAALLGPALAPLRRSRPWESVVGD